jgi:acetylornithine deacetylase/succinyl-diaminopimelate desuccinylase-like protein
MTRRAVGGLLLGLLILGSFHCRRVSAVAEDPLAREASAMLIDYLRIDSSNPPGNETAAAVYLQRILAREGIPATLVGSDPKRQSVYARLRSGSPKKALLLLHHLDVVPADRAEWTKDPFSGKREQGYIWGRGALDIKSLGVAEVLAMLDLKRRNATLDRDVVLLGVADEEAGGARGCRELLETRPELFDNVGYVLNEGGYNETVVDRVSFWGIEVAQKVPLWLRISTKGPAEHAASPPDDGGSIARLIAALSAVEAIPRPYRLVPSVQRLFDQLGRTRKDARGALLRNIASKIQSPEVDAVLSSGYRSLLHDTLAVTRIAGGTSTNSIPSHASADLDIRLLPDGSPDAMIRKVQEAIGRQATMEVLMRGEPTPESPIDSDLYRVLERAMRRAEPDSVVGPSVGAGTTDSRYFRARGVAAYGIAPFKVNYYDADTVHGIDERIRERFFHEGLRLVREVVDDFCVRKQ